MLAYDDLQPAFKATFDLLKPGGRFFLTVLTPYTKIPKQDYQNEFDKQIEEFIALCDHKHRKNGFRELNLKFGSRSLLLNELFYYHRGKCYEIQGARLHRPVS